MQTSRRFPDISITFSLLWIISVLSIFVYFPARISYLQWSNLRDLPLFFDKTGQINIAQFSLDVLAAFTGLIFFSLAATSLGFFLMRISKLNKTLNLSPTLPILATYFLVGHGILSLVFYTLAGLYKITSPITVFILLVALLSGAKGLITTIKALFHLPRLENKQEQILFWVSVLITFSTLLLTSARISYDSSAIYFSDAKITAYTGQIYFFTNDTFVASVFQTAIQFAVMIQAFGDQSARMLSWIFGLVIIIISLALGKEVGLSKTAKLFLLILLLTSTSFVDLFGDGKVDLMSTAPAIAAIYWITIQNKAQSTNKSVFILIGFLAGLAIVGRPFNIFTLGLFFALYFLQVNFLHNKPSPAGLLNFFESLAWIGIGAIGLGAFHLFANWMLFGSPLAFVSSLSNINPSSGPWDFDPKQMLMLRLFYPLAATFRNTPQSLGNISPLAMAFLPTLLLGGVRKRLNLSRELIKLAGIGLITLLAWIFTFFTVVEIRYVFFLWILLFLPIAEIISRVLESGDRLFQGTSFSLIILLSGFIAFRAIFISLDSYSPVDHQGNAKCSDFLLCDYLTSVNKAAQPGDRVLTLSAYRYYLRSDLFACSTKHKEYELLQESSTQSTDSFWEEVYRQGYSYLVYENDYASRHLMLGFVPGPENIPDWVQLERIDTSNSNLVAAYKIHYTKSPVVRLNSCQMNNQGIWVVQENQ